MPVLQQLMKYEESRAGLGKSGRLRQRDLQLPQRDLRDLLTVMANKKMKTSQQVETTVATLFF